VFAPFPDIPQWAHWGVQTSNGAAFHPNLDQAIDAAWLELVERDAFLRTWRLGLDIRAVATERLPTTAKEIVRWIVAKHENTRVAVGLLAHKPAPVWIVFASGPDIGVCIGAAAGRFRRSVDKAAGECLGQVLFPSPPVEAPESVKGPTDHLGYFRFGQRFRSADRLFNSLLHDESMHLLSFKDASPRGYYVELELPAGVDGHAVRVIDPDLMPMTFGFDAEPLGRLLSQQALLVDVAPSTDLASPHPFG
jgi:hypothetical protein